MPRDAHTVTVELEVHVAPGVIVLLRATGQGSTPEEAYRSARAAAMRRAVQVLQEVDVG